MFNEVFLTDAHVRADAIIGDRNNGGPSPTRPSCTSGPDSAPVAGRACGHPGVAGQRRRPASPAPGLPPRRVARKGGAGPSACSAPCPRCSRTWPAATALRRPDRPPGPGPAPHPRRARPVQQPAAQGGQAGRRGHPRHAQHLKLAMSDMMRLIRTRPAHRRSGRDAPRLRGRRQGRDRGRHRQPVPQPGHLGIAVGAGAVDLRRDRPDPAQHHRRAGARAAQGAQQRQDPAVLGVAEERLTTPSLCLSGRVRRRRRAASRAVSADSVGRRDRSTLTRRHRTGGWARRRPVGVGGADPAVARKQVIADWSPWWCWSSCSSGSSQVRQLRRGVGVDPGDVGQLAGPVRPGDRREHPHLRLPYQAALPGLAYGRPSSCARRRS